LRGAEVSEIPALPERTVKTCLHRARRLLIDFLSIRRVLLKPCGLSGVQTDGRDEMSGCGRRAADRERLLRRYGMNGTSVGGVGIRRACLIVMVVAGLLGTAGLWAQEGDRPGFVEELLSLLQSEGWTVEELRALAGQGVPWEEAEGANPEVVALALQLARSEDEELEPMVQALMAIDLARAAIEMENLGIGELTIALSALEGVREILTDIQAFRSGGLEGNLGEAIRTRMRGWVTAAAREQTQKRVEQRLQEAKANRPAGAGLVPDVPVGGLPGSGYTPWW